MATQGEAECCQPQAVVLASKPTLPLLLAALEERNVQSDVSTTLAVSAAISDTMHKHLAMPGTQAME